MACIQKRRAVPPKWRAAHPEQRNSLVAASKPAEGGGISSKVNHFVGQRVRVWWEDEQQHYYGTVVKYDEWNLDDEKYVVKYDDGYVCGLHSNRGGHVSARVRFDGCILRGRSNGMRSTARSL
eukprot:7389493-Prymnesium_polylepis.1